MVIINLGLNGARDYVANGLDDCLAGTGTATALTTDLGLSGTDASTEADLTTTLGDRNITTQYIMTTALGGTTEYSEYASRFGSGTVFTRVVTAPIAKNLSNEIHVITGINILNG